MEEEETKSEWEGFSFIPVDTEEGYEGDIEESKGEDVGIKDDAQQEGDINDYESE